MTDLEPAGRFYNRLSKRYDEMTDFEARRARARMILEPLVRSGGIHRAADMGCGTGVHVLALAELSVDTLGIDIAEDVIALARGKAAGTCLPARFETGDLRSPALSQLGPFDLILCLGNTLPHLETTGALRDTFLHWRGALSESGMVMVQCLNYDRILRTRERIINVRRQGARTIVRFYDFTEPRLVFNILTLEDTADGIGHDLQSTALTPFLRGDLAAAARDAGFADVRFHSGMSLEPWKEDGKDIVGVFREHAPALR